MKKSACLLFVLANFCIFASMANPAPDMTPEQADAVLNKYVTATEYRGGLCLVGFNPGASLDYEKPVSVSNAKIEFVGRFGKPFLFGKALPGKEGVKAQYKRTVVDATRIKKFRIIDKRVYNLRQWCPNVRPHYLVVLYPKDSLPSDAEVSINVNSHDELVELMAALTYLSPKAKLKGKY